MGEAFELSLDPTLFRGWRFPVYMKFKKLREICTKL